MHAHLQIVQKVDHGVVRGVQLLYIEVDKALLVAVGEELLVLLVPLLQHLVNLAKFVVKVRNVLLE